MFAKVKKGVEIDPSVKVFFLAIQPHFPALNHDFQPPPPPYAFTGDIVTETTNMIKIIMLKLPVEKISLISLFCIYTT